MTIVNKLVKSIRKAPKKMGKAFKKLTILPRVLLTGLRDLWGMLTSAASKVAILPANSLSGKLLAVTQLLFFINILLGVGYGYGRWQGQDTLVAVAENVAPYTLGGFVVFGIAFLVVYPLDRRGLVRAFIVDSAVRQRLRLFIGPVSVLTGLTTALIVAVLLGNKLFRPEAGIRSLYMTTLGFETAFDFELAWRWTVLAFVLSFGVTTAVVHRVLSTKKRTSKRTDLAVVETTEQEYTQTLRLRNDSDFAVDLSRAKVVDSLGNRYTLERDLTFRPGETQTLILPQEFVLETTDIQVPAGLGALYPDERITKIYAISGDIFLLEWTEQRAEETEESEESESEETIAVNAD